MSHLSWRIQEDITLNLDLVNRTLWCTQTFPPIISSYKWLSLLSKLIILSAVIVTLHIDYRLNHQIFYELISSLSIPISCPDINPLFTPAAITWRVMDLTFLYPPRNLFLIIYITRSLKPLIHHTRIEDPCFHINIIND